MIPMSNPTFDLKTLKRRADEYMKRGDFPLIEEERIAINGFLDFLVNNDEAVNTLLLQLSLLVNFDSFDTAEFKADIARMEIDEQISFLKNMIRSEAIRVAKRKKISVEEVLESIKTETLSDEIENKELE